MRAAVARRLPADGLAGGDVGRLPILSTLSVQMHADRLFPR